MTYLGLHDGVLAEVQRECGDVGGRHGEDTERLLRVLIAAVQTATAHSTVSLLIRLCI